MLLKSVNSNNLKKLHSNKLNIKVFVLYAEVYKKRFKDIWSKLLPEDSKTHTFCPSVIMTATIKALKSETSKSWSFLNDYNLIPWGNSNEKMLQVVLVFRQMSFGTIFYRSFRFFHYHQC